MPQFQAGNGYGKGRPKGSGRNQKIQEWCEKFGVQKLLDLAEGKGVKVGLDKNGKIVRVGPSEEICYDALKLSLAYGLGRPTDSVDITSGGETLRDILIAAINEDAGESTETEDKGKS